MSETGNSERPQGGNLWQRSFGRFLNREGSGDQIARFTDLAQGFSRELTKHPENGTLILVLGQSATEVIANQSGNYTDESSGLVFGKMKNSAEAAGVFSQFWAIDPNTRVVLVVDEGLDKEKDKNGLGVAKSIIDSTPDGAKQPKLFIITNVKRDLRTDRTRPLSWRAEELGLKGNLVGTMPTTNLNNLLPIAFDSLERGIDFHDAINEHEEKNRRAREKQANVALQEVHERVIKQLESTDAPRFKEKAEQVIAELAAISGKKAFALIIDDYYPKVADMSKPILEDGQKRSISYVLRDVRDGDEGIVFYEEFAKLAPGEKVVILMDGNLGHGDTGPLVTERLIDATKRHNLPMPYIVGSSSDNDKNEGVQALAQEHYLGAYFRSQNDNNISFQDTLAEKL